MEKDKFCFTGLDFSAVEDGIKITMRDYMQSFEDVKDIRKADCEEELSILEMKEY